MSNLTQEHPLKISLFLQSEKNKIKLNAFANYFMLSYSLLFFLVITTQRLPSIPFSWTGKIIAVVLKFLIQILFVFDNHLRDQLTYFINYYGEDSIFIVFYTIFCFIVSVIIAMGLTLWRSDNSSQINRWWHNIARFIIAWWMFFYGIVKAIPVQMPQPVIDDLLSRPYQWDKQNYFWYMLGVSPGYEMVTGWIEVIDAILLLIPRFSVFGGFISLISFSVIELFDIFYGIPLRIIVAQLIIYETIALYPILKKFILYLLGKIDLPKIKSQRTLQIKSTRLRGSIIGIYWLIIIGYAFASTLYFWNIYRADTVKNTNPLVGLWLMTSIQKTPNSNKVDSQSKDWEIIEITGKPYSTSLVGVYSTSVDSNSFVTYNALHATRIWSFQPEFAKHELHIAPAKHKPKIDIHYELLPNHKAKDTASSPQQAIFTVYADHKPSLIIHANKYILPIGHPEQEQVDYRGFDN